MVKFFKIWIKRRKTKQELERLDNRMLKDIGINRGEIHYIVKTSIY